MSVLYRGWSTQIMPVLGRPSKRSSGGKHPRQTMERLREDTRKSVWYVFDTLSNISTGKVMKSQLKVLTSTIGLVLSMDKAEEILSKENSTNDLSYLEFIKILEEELFSKVDNATLEKLNLTDNDLEEVHRNCWVLYFKVKKEPKGSMENLKALPEEACYKLWRVYNFLSEEDESGMPLLPVKIHVDEAKHVIETFVGSTGQVTLLAKIDDAIHSYSLQDGMSFQTFETMIVNRFTSDLTDLAIKQATKELFQQYISDTIIKGMLCKRGYQVKNWKDRWMVLNTRQLTYYTASDERERKGDVQLDQDCKVEVIPDAGVKSGSRQNRFVLKTPAKPYEMSAHDIKTRNDWMTALQKAIDKCSNENYHFHRIEAKERQKVRREGRRQKEEEERRRREEEESLQKMKDLLKTKQEEEEQQRLLHLAELEKSRLKLEEEERQSLQHVKELETARLNQLDLEARLHAEEALRKQEQQRLRELEEIKKQLERLLEEERQAKRDEEIVRALQARLLDEEMEKREELETLRREQEQLLKQEISRREGLEEHQNEQARKLQEAAETLQKLEAQRRAAEQDLTEASVKLQEAEKERVKLQHKVTLWKTPTVGLARPIPPRVGNLTTHRGRGAFCEDDFRKLNKDEKSIDETGSDVKEEEKTDTSTDITKDTSDLLTPTEINEKTEPTTEVDIEQDNKNDEKSKPEQESVTSEAIKETEQAENKATDSPIATEKCEDLKSEFVESTIDHQ
ncbi:differentially expressed in FDCP 6 homolog isoform X2 [Mizuhopecten yessoensis]|uniref:differentially expressed in FDCP 6 homolog isoform X2 n=1 Tax=Mizuhopecten yessoensis TaxID=6573 RepID=UPI000B458A86|nr:differentially expressed in FDCP 6 homolog isoform X2 [Mizuhopecten yessoensis]